MLGDPESQARRLGGSGDEHLPGSKATGINKVTSGRQWRGWCRVRREEMVSVSDWKHPDRGGLSAVFKATRVLLGAAQAEDHTTRSMGVEGLCPRELQDPAGGRGGLGGERSPDGYL